MPFAMSGWLLSMGTIRCGYSNWPERSTGQPDEVGEAEGIIEVFVIVAKVELPCTGVAAENAGAVPDEGIAVSEAELAELGAILEAGELLDGGPPVTEDTELILGAGNGPGIGVCVDPAPPPTTTDAVPLATELDEADSTLAVEEAVMAELEDAEEIAGHCRLYSGVVVKLEPTIPKLGLGVVGAASCTVYHQVLTLPNSEHPTWSQYV